MDDGGLTWPKKLLKSNFDHFSFIVRKRHHVNELSNDRGTLTDIGFTAGIATAARWWQITAYLCTFGGSLDVQWRL